MYFIYTGVEMKRQSKYAKWWNWRQLSSSQACVLLLLVGNWDYVQYSDVSWHTNCCLKMQIYSSPEWQLFVSNTARPSAEHVSFSAFFSSPSVSQILSLTLSGEQSSLCWPSTRSENRSNHLFIDWNIRGLRGSGRVGATKSGKKTEWLKDKK